MITSISPTVEESLRRLAILVHEFESISQQAQNQPELPRLAIAVDALDVPRALRAPVGIEEYVQQWKSYLDGSVNSLSRRAISALCWHPPTATDKTFQYYLDHNAIKLNSRSLQGLIRSCHALWSLEIAVSDTIKKVRKRLDLYDGRSRLLTKWKRSGDMILGNSAAESFGREMLRQAQPIKDFCAHWCVDESSSYVQWAVAKATELCRGQMARVEPLRRYLTTELLSWRAWPLDRFKKETSITILHPATSNEDVRDSLRKFVVTDIRLGDPRLPGRQMNWAGIRDAERKVIEWFSRFDIVFFFEHVLPRGNDPHGRKEFWLRYVNRIGRSRSLLNWSDRYRLNRNLKGKDLESTSSGRMADFEKTSSFLLDFGKIVVVEFSAVGNACYVYTESNFNKSIASDFWTNKAFTAHNLKNQRLSLTKQSPLWDGVHRAGWQLDASQLLAMHGVRP